MFRWFETRVDPFQNYDDGAPLPSKLSAFYKSMLWPMRWVIVLSLLLSGAAALFEVLVFHYVQRIVDMLGEATPETLWQQFGTELIVIAAVVLVLRPLIEVVAITYINLTYLPPVAAMVRWRSHRQVLRQSLSFFQNDFAGRIAQKIVQTGPAVGDSVYTALEALWYAAIYTVGAFILLADFDWRLVAVFTGLAGGLCRHRRLCDPAHRRSGEADVRGPLRDDRANRRQLYEYPDREALRPFRPRGRLCPRGDR